MEVGSVPAHLESWSVSVIYHALLGSKAHTGYKTARLREPLSLWKGNAWRQCPVAVRTELRGSMFKADRESLSLERITQYDESDGEAF